MKHAIKSLFIVLASVSVVAACTKENVGPTYKAGETITITATLPTVPPANPASKVDFTQEDGSISLAWSESDRITIIDEATGDYSVFTLTGTSGSKATFTGTAIEGDSFTVLYPGTVTSVDAMDDFSFTGQTQTGDANLAHLKNSWTAKITGLSDFSDVKFAAPDGGTFSQSGILKFRLQMPDYVSTVKSVSIEAGSDVFYTDNNATQAGTLTLGLSSITLDAKNSFTAYMAISQKDSDALDVDDVVTLKVVDGDDLEWKKEITLTEAFQLQAGKVNVLTLNKDDWDTVERYAGGTGVDGDPWLISNAIHMVHMNEDLASGTTKYFKMIADVDMAPVTDWVPANNPDPYDKKIDFDGDNHIINNFSCSASKYPSMFGVLYGSVRNVTYKNASVTCTAATAAGIVAGYFGTGTKSAELINVHVEGTVTNSGAYAGIGGVIGKAAANSYDEPAISGCSFKGTLTSTGAKNGVGGFAGIAQNLVIEKCWVDATISNNANYAGGLIGYEAAAIEIRNCWTSGSISANQRIGGIIAGAIKNNTAVKNCYSMMSLSASVCMGGIVGHASLDKWSASTSSPNNVIEKCIAWNPTIKTTQTPTEETKNQGSSGAIVGYGSINNYLTDCYRRPDMVFSEGWAQNTPYDQANASPSSPLTEVLVGTYNFPYHGKAAAAGKTLSEVAQSLGWDAAIWDFSGALPTLK